MASRLLLVLALLLSASVARADTLFVDPSGLTPHTGIQDAIDVAADGDVVVVFPGTYGAIDFLGKDLVVRALAGPTLTTIDGTGSGGPAVTIASGEPSTTLLHGFTITGGTGAPDDAFVVAMGGGVYVSRMAAPRISGNVIVGNTAVSGGGLAVTGGAAQVYGNVIRENTATGGVGGVALVSPLGFVGTTTFACNQVLGNSGTGVGGLFVETEVSITNNVIHGNDGERGGAWFGGGASGDFHNNTVTTNVSDPSAAAGVHVESDQLDAVGNLIASNAVGLGVVHSAPTPSWSWNDVWGNAGGAWSGAAPDPTGTDGNVAVEPFFTTFTTANPFDDDLTLVATDPLLDAGNPDPAFDDLDGSRGAIGMDGGPHLACDGDGDGVRAIDTPADCQPDEADFHPGAFENTIGLDLDCNGFGTLELFEFVLDDGGLVSDAAALWGFAPPTLLPGTGWQGVNAWCTGCAGGAGGAADGTLTLTADLTSLPASTGARVSFVHAYDADPTTDGGILQAWDGAAWVQLGPTAGYPETLSSTAPGNAMVGAAALGTWSGDSGGYTSDAASLSAYAGTSVDLRWWYASATGSTAPGWTVARVALEVVDADGDGRSVSVTDCDDSDASIYDGAPETPYDGIDQDCDGSDLLDVDGDGFDGVGGGGDDCDDDDATVNPQGIEVPYDGIDQDCDGADLVDLDGDGFASWEAGGDDCNDEDADVSPDADDVPYDGSDQDCDGADLVDVDGDGFRGDQGPPFGDCDDEDASVHPDAEEICDDGKDNDCNELVDAEVDLDVDGYDVCAGDCDETSSLVHPGAEERCDGLDNDCDGALIDGEVDADADGDFVCDGDCDDASPLVGPSRPEVCDGVDNDCDFGIDEDQDGDGDGFSGCTSDCDDQRSTVYPGAPIDCTDNLDHDCDGARDFEQPECTDTGCSLGASPTPSPLLLLLILLALVRRRSAVLEDPGGP